jgi:hypothetical protein
VHGGGNFPALGVRFHGRAFTRGVVATFPQEVLGWVFLERVPGKTNQHPDAGLDKPAPDAG